MIHIHVVVYQHLSTPGHPRSLYDVMSSPQPHKHPSLSTIDDVYDRALKRWWSTTNRIPDLLRHISCRWDGSDCLM
ncbi:hypothetical protein M404DRAFT_1002519 [Pisolithus tinctorius Marx 270]|uniref:Uncharacterized protein n=1 Tax=Pisolithus tinctorius Marx 270 TaxID=870435 RepID=A0A0C3P3N2_PISTI|nr:hypothetical protein M404DRAFT_1002519 [Pisolithus tinctorius Marx 270]